MATWTVGATRSTGDIITAAQWNNYLGAGGSFDFLADSTGNLTLNATKALTLTFVGPHAIGGATISNVSLALTGTFAPATTPVSFYINQSLTGVVGSDSYGIYINSILNKAGSGTHADFAAALFTAPTIGAGAAALTNSTTVKITGAPSVGTNQRALWVAAGLSQFDGTARVTSQTVPTSGAGLELDYISNIATIRGYDRTGSAYKNVVINDNITVAGSASGAITFGGKTTHNSGISAASGITSALQMNMGSSIGPSTTRYQGPGVPTFQVTEALANWPTPFAATLKNLYVNTSTTQGAAGTLVITVRKNGVNTALALTINAAAAAATFSDTTHSFTVVAGDLITVSVVNNDASNNSAAVDGISIQMDSTG